MAWINFTCKQCSDEEKIPLRQQIVELTNDLNHAKSIIENDYYKKEYFKLVGTYNDLAEENYNKVQALKFRNEEIKTLNDKIDYLLQRNKMLTDLIPPVVKSD